MNAVLNKSLKEENEREREKQERNYHNKALCTKKVSVIFLIKPRRGLVGGCKKNTNECLLCYGKTFKRSLMVVEVKRAWHHR